MTRHGRDARRPASARRIPGLAPAALIAAVLLAATLLAAGLAACAAGSGGAAGGAAAPGSTKAAEATPTPKTTKKPHKRTPKPTPKPRATKEPAAQTATRPATRVVFVNVGQGDAIILKSGSWTGLIDGGPSGSEGAIESALGRLGVRRLAAVVVTHPHADHTGGLPGVVYDYRPRQAYVGEGAGSAGSALRGVGARITRVRRGMTLRFGALKARVLSPGSLTGDANADSVVLLVDAGGKRLLFTGDCTGANEAYVGGVCARGPPLYLLKVAHHGSRYSTSPAFLSETDPKFAVISVGRNSYGHPTPQTISALRADGARIYSTQKNGTVTLTVSAAGAASWSFSKSSKAVTSAPRSAGGSGGGGGAAAVSSSSGKGGGTIVYITETGECYHRGDCRYLSHSKIKISLKDAKAQGYRPCSVCDPPQ